MSASVQYLISAIIGIPQCFTYQVRFSGVPHAVVAIILTHSCDILAYMYVVHMILSSVIKNILYYLLLYITYYYLLLYSTYYATIIILHIMLVLYSTYLECYHCRYLCAVQ